MEYRRVITTARFVTKDTGALLNRKTDSRVVTVGCRADESSAGLGYFGKVVEQSAGTSVLDYGVWCDLCYPHVIGIFGTRGSGKSFDIGVLAEDIGGANGVTTGEVPSATSVIFDIQNQFWTLGFAPDPSLSEDLEQIASLESWDLVPSALQLRTWTPAGCPPVLRTSQTFRISPSQLTGDDWLALLEVDRYSPIGQALLTLIKESENHDPVDLVASIPACTALAAFQSATVDALLWRLQALAETDLVGSPGVTVDDFLQMETVNIVLLRDLPDSLRALCVGVLTRLLVARMSAYHQARRVARRLHEDIPTSDLPDRLWLFIDEAHTVVPREGRTAASAPVVDAVKRGRDAGVSAVFATQQPSAVDSRLMSQVDMTVTHALGFESDLQAAVARMPTRNNVEYARSGFAMPSLGDTIRCLGPGEAILADSTNGRVFALQIRPRVTAHGGNTPPAENEA